MITWNITIIILLCVILLKPEDITALIKNMRNIIIHLNTYISSVKEKIITSIDLDKKF